MTDEKFDANHDVARRSVLRSAAVAGGAALWAVPAVQVLGMSPASAQGTSPVPGTTPPTLPPGTTPPATTPPSNTTTTPPPTGGTTPPPTGGTTPPPTGGTTPPPTGATPGGSTTTAGQTPGGGRAGGGQGSLARTGIEVAAVAAAGAGLVVGGVAVAKASGTGRHTAGKPDTPKA